MLDVWTALLGDSSDAEQTRWHRFFLVFNVNDPHQYRKALRSG